MSDGAARPAPMAAMPCYHIDTDDDRTFVRDVEGQDLSSRNAARLAGLAALPDMVRDRIPGEDRRTFVVNVRDDDGRTFYTACLTLVGRWLD